MNSNMQRPIAVLSACIDSAIARFRECGWLRALAHKRVNALALADVVADQKEVAGIAYAAEQCDAEAVKIIEEAAADGFSNSDLPAVAKALRLIKKSQRLDHDCGERLGS